MENADRIARALGLERVGLVFTHAPGRGYDFSSSEIITLAQETLLSRDADEEEKGDEEKGGWDDDEGGGRR